MQEIETKAILNYQENMLYFKKSHPDLHTKLLALDTLLNEGKYPQKYDLEYKDNYFDVVDINSNNMLYKQDSNIYSKDLSDNVNLQKNIQSFKSYRKFVFTKETLEIYKTQDAYKNYSSIAHIVDYHNNNCDDSMHMTKINKYIFLGVGLGLHIDNIVKKFNIPISLIIEDDIELFRLSMFTTNYNQTFNNRSVFFSISQNHNEFNATFNNFFTKAFFKNNFIKYSLFSSNYESKIDQIRSYLISRPEATYSNERLLVKNKKVLQKIKEKYKFLNLEKKQSEELFKDKPCLLIGAGPSLQNNIEWLKENHKKYVIIAVLASLKTLKNAGISPDIALHIDEDTASTDRILESLGSLDFMKNTLLIFSASVEQTLFDSFDKEKIYLHEDRTKYKLNKSTIAVTSIGETTYSLALIFNAPSIYLLGLDFALSDDGKTHSEDHTDVATIKEIKNENDDFQLSDNIIYVKGNQKDKVKSLPILALSIPVFNSKTKEYKTKEQNIYNLSQSGAYFDDTISLNISDIKEKNDLDKSITINSIEKTFDSYSSEELSNIEYKEIENKLEQISNFNTLLEKFKVSPTSNDDIFLLSFENLASSIFNDAYHFELWEILIIYLLRVSSYIDDFFNTVEVKNKKKHIKKLKQFLIIQLGKIISTYEDDLNMLKITEAA